MELHNIKVVAAVTYVAVVSVAGLTAGATSAAAWAVIACVALLPAVTMLSRWHEPSQTLSQAIQGARR
jgi:hypothetical protein